MIITKITGGMGNQLFTYAIGRALAEKLGVPLKMDLEDYDSGADKRPDALQAFSRKYKLADFNITGTVATPDEINAVRDPFRYATTASRIVRRMRKIIPGLFFPASETREAQYRFQPEVMQLGSPRYLMGFWQSYKYFESIEPIIRREFTLKDPAPMQKGRSIVAPLKADGSPVVALHVRRGDLAHAYEVNRPDTVYGPPVGLDYIYAAMKKFDAGCKFLVFSDTAKDIQWCRDNIQADRLYFCEGNNDLEDFATMQLCDHNIVANSTFSWWAAWLNANPGKRIVCPATWSAPGAKIDMVTDDLIPPTWEKITAK